MELRTIFTALIHGVAILSLAAVIGGLALEYLMASANAPASMRRRLRYTIGIGFGLLVLTTIGMLVIRIQAIGRESIVAALLAIPEIVGETHVGRLLGLRLAAFALAGGLYATVQNRFSRALSLLLSLGGAAAFTLTSHAAAWGDWTVYTATDFLHVIAASVWIGGLIGLAAMIAGRSSSASTDSMVTVIRRFSPIAALCLVTVLSTGIYHASAQLNSFSSLSTTPYGYWLLAKGLLVIVVIFLGAVNRYVMLPAVHRDRSTRALSTRLLRLLPLILRRPVTSKRSSLAPSAMLTLFIVWEAALSVGVFAATAALSQTVPAREVLSERKKTIAFRPIARPSGQSIRSAIVTPPNGNAASGRAVFMSLRCHNCHATRGNELLPTPNSIGPKLTNARLLHPSFLMETLMKPHPMSAPLTLATIGDYRDKLSVQELIDLVAYLRTL